MEINKNTKVVLNNSKVYHTNLTYYEGSQQKQKQKQKQKKELKICHSVNGRKVGFSYEVAWYENGLPKYQRIYKDGKLDGLWEAWYDNGQPWYRWNYKDGKEDWYSNRQPKYRSNYKDSKEDGLQEGWYKSGQPEYQKIYKMGRLILEQYF